MMKKVTDRIVALILIAVISVVSGGFEVKAAVYPSLYQENFTQSCYQGDTIYFEYTIFPEYKNENLYVNIYNEDGDLVASVDQEFYNYDTSIRYFTTDWDTSNTEPGKYTAVATMEFYTFSEWHTAPRDKTCTVHIKKKPKNGVSIKKAENIEGYKIKTSWKKVSKAKKYQIKIGGKKYITKKTSYKSKALKKEKFYSVKVRAYVGGKWGPWSPVREVYTGE